MERDDRERDGRQDARENERDREEQERYQSQVPLRGPPMPGPYPIPHHRGQEQGSFRSFDQGRGDFSENRPFPPGFSEEQIAAMVRNFMAQQQLQKGGFQDGPQENFNPAQIGGSQVQRSNRVCWGWMRGNCVYGSNCSFLHYLTSSSEGEHQSKKPRRD